MHFSLFMSIGSFIILLLFNSLSTQTSTVTVSSPSLTTYNHLQALHLNTLRCPCSNMTIPYHTFTSLSPIFHPVCSSDFVSDPWLKMLTVLSYWSYLTFD